LKVDDDYGILLVAQQLLIYMVSCSKQEVV